MKMPRDPIKSYHMNDEIRDSIYSIVSRFAALQHMQRPSFLSKKDNPEVAKAARELSEVVTADVAASLEEVALTLKHALESPAIASAQEIISDTLKNLGSKHAETTICLYPLCVNPAHTMKDQNLKNTGGN